MSVTFLTNEDKAAYQKEIADVKASISGLQAAGGSTFNYAEYGIPILYLNGDITGMDKDNEVTLNYVFGEKTGTLTCKWQGSSSLAYDKKNYTVKFDEAFEASEGWGVQKKYCLKANYIDFSHARNIVSAKLWGTLCRFRGEQFNFYNLPNCGAVDGFPCMVVINGEYQGLYSFNIPKDAWMFGFTGSANGECIISAEAHCDATAFKAPALVDGSDFEFEHIGDDTEGTKSYVVQQFNRIHEKLTTVTSKDELYTSLGEVIDMASVIDYMIFVAMITANDCIGKNYLIVSQYGGWFQFSAYDLDSVFGNDWDGKGYLPASRCSFAELASRSALFNAIYTYAPDELVSRYWGLRYNVFDEEKVCNLFENYIAQIPKAVLDAEVKLWPGIPGTETNNLTQIVNNYRMKLSKLDYEISQLNPST